MLPPELLTSIAECTSSLQLRQLCYPFCSYTLIQLKRYGITTQTRRSLSERLCKVVAHVLNHAAYDGNLSVLLWAVASFEVEFVGKGMVEFPFAFALEQGHLHILQHYFPAVLPLEPLQHMNKSLPAAINLGHLETAEWVIDQLELLGKRALGFSRAGGNIDVTYTFERLRSGIRSKSEHREQKVFPFEGVFSSYRFTSHSFSHLYCQKLAVLCK